MSLTKEAADFLADVPAAQLECMAQRHPWPVIKISAGKLPKGIVSILMEDGTRRIVEICPNCGKKRYYYTLPGGVFDVSAPYAYDDPEDWLTKPSEIAATRRDYKGELFRRAAGLLS